MKTSYPPQNCDLEFLEPFPRVEKWSNGTKYLVRACINGSIEKDIRIDRKQQMDVIDQLMASDRKLLGAVVRVNESVFSTIRHSPQTDFLEIVEEE